jgi:rod shape determining protein RodA
MPMTKLLDRNMDFGLLGAVIMLMIFGVVMIHSASSGAHIDYSYYWAKQLIWTLVAIVIMLAVTVIHPKYFYAFAYFFYGFGIFFLILVDFFGIAGGGSERWLVFGPLRFQPSEFMKIATILVLARYMSIKKNRPRTYLKCVVPFLIIFFPMIFILKQPDLGTSLVFIAFFLPMIYWAGLDNLRFFFLIAPMISAILSAPFIPIFSWVTWVVFMYILLVILYYSRYEIWNMGVIIFTNILAGIAIPIVFSHLKPYQQKRLTSLINPEADPLGAGWQVINSKIAIGSGGLLGKGLGKGRYTELGFLPRSHTDFIFSVVGEELGFVGSLVMIFIFVYVIYRGVMIAAELKNDFMSIAALGIAATFAFHLFINIGMATGVMPVTGLPLPFISYGGSSCVTNAIMIGFLLNFHLHRHDF